MTKFEIESIRTLPDEYVADGTQVCLVGVWCVAVNPNLVPIIRKWDTEWAPMKINLEESIPVS